MIGIALASEVVSRQSPDLNMPPKALPIAAPVAPLETIVVTPEKPEVSQSEFEAKKPSYSERLAAQKLARTIYLSQPNPRGQILGEYYDKNGKRQYAVLANSRNGRYFQIDFSSIITETDPVKIYQFAKDQLAWIKNNLGFDIALTEYEVLTYFEHRRWIPLRVGSNLTSKQVELLIKNRRALPEGLGYLDIPLRNYPQKSLAGHLIGAVKRSNGWPLREFAEGDLLFPSIEGIRGLEISQDAKLNGIPTVYKYEFDEQGRAKGDPQVVTQGRPGLNIVLSLDVEMQRIAENLLKKHTAQSGTGKGAMVVIDIETMEIKALASWPVFDPNDYVPVITKEAQDKWKADVNNPMLARAFGAAYPPASTFKLATGLMALASGVTEPEEARYRCFNSVTYHENNMKNWTQETGQPYMTVADALKRSCNTWFFQAANEMQSRSKVFEKWFHHLMPMLGLGKPTGLEVIGETTGNVYVKDGQALPFFEGAHVANISIGQGDLAVTPLQLAQMVARIAAPAQTGFAHVIRGRQDVDGNWASVAQVVDEQAQLEKYEDFVSWIRKGMWDVVYGNFGTGPAANARNFSVVGKTGTAQWSNNRNVAWFASYAPYYDGSANYPSPSKYAVVVFQEGNSGQTLSGGKDAAPVVGEFFKTPYVEARMSDHLMGGSAYSDPNAPRRAIPVDE